MDTNYMIYCGLRNSLCTFILYALTAPPSPPTKHQPPPVKVMIDMIDVKSYINSCLQEDTYITQALQ